MLQQIGKKMTVGSLFSGIGGLDLGLERAGMKVLWQCEIDPYCQQILRKHWPESRLYNDIRGLRGSELPYTDVLCGGFPCQDVSQNGHRAGIVEGTRSGLWFEYARLIGEVKPRWVIIENVLGLLSIDDGRGFGRVLYDLANLGYDAEWEVIQANWFGLPHIRKRLLIIAHPKSFGRSIFEQGRSTIDAQMFELQFEHPSLLSACVDGNTPGILAPDIRTGDGLSDRLDVIAHRLGACGNAVVPPMAEYVGRLIVEAERSVA